MSALVRQIQRLGLEQVRFAWCDLHGQTRAKALSVGAAVQALRKGVGMVGTLALKDSSDRTAFAVFDPEFVARQPGLAGAANLLLKPIESTFKVLPWAPRTGWIQCEASLSDGTPLELDTRRQLRRALQTLAAQRLGMACGLEVEFHVYRLAHPDAQDALDPHAAQWPGPAPAVHMLHAGYHLLSEASLDQCDEMLAIVRRTAQALDLPLSSLEIEIGPSQFEAVFDVSDALTAADHMVLFRSAVRQALRRAGYHATFMCRPPFPSIMSSGWHLHQSLLDLPTGRNAFVPVPSRAAAAAPGDARQVLSDLGAHYLAGLLEHAPGMTALCTSTVNGFGRFSAHAMAPQSVVWGRDNRGAMLRVIGGPGESATRIENRLGEPAANPYLYLAAQIYAGLDGIARGALPAPATESPYAQAAERVQRIPGQLGQALAALAQDPVLCAGLGAQFVEHYRVIKQLEQDRFDAASDKLEFSRREYFGRI
jgi:glutamine synthetase